MTTTRSGSGPNPAHAVRFEVRRFEADFQAQRSLLWGDDGLLTEAGLALARRAIEVGSACIEHGLRPTAPILHVTNCLYRHAARKRGCLDITDPAYEDGADGDADGDDDAW